MFLVKRINAFDKSESSLGTPLIPCDHDPSPLSLDYCQQQ